MNLSAAQNAQRDIRYHLHPFTDLKRHEKIGPMIIDRGEGIYLFDSAGNRYLDAMSSLWCCTLGYSEPRLVQAAHEQLQRLPYSHTFRGRSHDKLIELADRLVSVAPSHLTRAFFASSGSEANESAIKLAWSFHKFRKLPNKRKVIARRNGYHGSTIFASRLSGMPSMHEFVGHSFPEIIYVDCPHHYALALPGETQEQFATRLAEQLDQTIRAEGADTVSAFIAEPVMGVGGVIVPPISYFEKVQEVLRRYDVLLIADEVICGFGRTGNMFGSDTFTLEPDILTVAKGMSSAYFPISATLVSEPVYQTLFEESARYGVFSHGFTYSGHPVGAAVALEVLSIYEERNVVDHVRDVGAQFQARLRALESSPLIGEVRGVGLMAAAQLVQCKETKKNFPAAAGAGGLLMQNAELEGLFVRAVGDTIVIAPPLIIEPNEIVELTDRFERALVATQRTLS